VYTIKITKHGYSSVLERVPLSLSMPAPGEVRLRHTAIGLNFIDIYHRSGLYPLPLPSGLGLEAVGVIEEIGDAVDGFKIGDRVGYGWGPIGAYASHRLFPADRLVRIPDDISDEIAAAILLKGCTAEYLVRRTFAAKAGQHILVHAAAGGVGLLLCQWLHHTGATVIGTAGSPEKIELARAHGCAHVIDSRAPDIADQVRALTGGVGVAAVYDSVGKDTFAASIDSLQPRGTLVSFGNASGPVSAFDLGLLAAKGSLFVTRPTIAHYYASAQDRHDGTAALFDLVRHGILEVRINQRYALRDAATAQDDLAARRTTGSTVLLP
jgi:NADPH:quinone reductase